MAEYLDNYDDIVFLDSEIADDDSDDAPVGELITVRDGKVYRASDIAAEEAAKAAEDSVQASPAGSVTPIEALTPEEPAEEPVAVKTAEPEQLVYDEPEPVAEERAEEQGTSAETELPAPDPVYLYAYGITPAESAQPEQTAAEEAPAEEVAEEETALPEEEPETADAGQPDVLSEVQDEEPAGQTEISAEEETTPVEQDVAAEVAPVEDVAEEGSVAEEEAPAAAAAPAPKKKESHLIIQSAADDGNVWGAAVIKPAKKKAEKKPAEEAAADDANAAPKAEKPAEKTTKKQKAADVAAPDTAKEENKVAKEKKASESAKKETAKAAAKPAEKKAAKPAPAKKETAKAAEKKPAAKPAPAKPVKEETKPAKVVKEDTKPAEQVIEAGDESAPHGKFVIKKTDKGNFVYKLYSSNYRVVAIGAGLYTSIASCKTGINSVRNNAETAPIEDQTLQKWEEQKFPKWQIYTDKQGEIRLRLLASNGNIVATTNDGYLSKEAAKKGIAAIARAAKGASIVRNDDLW